MKQASDKSVDAFCKPGQPPVPHPKTLMQRQREYRQRQKFNFLNFVASDKKSKGSTQ